MVSLAELKTGKEKLELINQILLRIDTIARALDNTRLDEIVGLKESVNSLHEQTLELKQEVSTMYTSFSENKKDFDTKFSSVNEKFSIMQERFSFIEQAYNDFSSSKEELELIKGFIEENKPVFESLKDDLSKYESMKIDLEAIITEATNNTKLSKEYFELSSKIKDDILRELEHCKDLVQELNYSADELRGLKPELLQIKKEVNELSSQASKVVLDASEIIKNKINTIFFENQRLNQEMIDSVKKLDEIKYDVGIKYKEIIQAYNLLLETKESLEELKEVIALYKEFENDIKSYSELIKNFKEQIANLESDLENKAQGLHEALEAKGEQVISSIETAKNEAIVKFDELVAKCEGYKIHFEQSYDRFNQRALIANEDLGGLAEVAKKELGNDKLIYETELKALRDEILQEMNEVSDKVINDSIGVIASIDEKANELKDFIDISRVNIDNLINAFNANYNQKIQEFTSLSTNALRSVEEAKTSSLSDINTSKDESLSSIETSKDNALSSIEEAKTQGIASIDEKITQIDFNGIKERVEKNEGNIAGIEEKLEKATTTDKDNLFSGNNSFEKPISIPEATKENEGINLGQADGRYKKLLTQNLEWTVGDGAENATNFNDLEKAINEASKLIGMNRANLTVKLTKNITLDRSLNISNIDYSFLTLDFNNFKLTFTAGGIVLSYAKLKEIKNINIDSFGNSLYLVNSDVYLTGDITLKAGNDCLVSDAFSSIVIEDSANLNLTPNDNRFGVYANRTSSINGSLLKITQSKGIVTNVKGSSIINVKDMQVTGGATESSQPFNQWTKEGFIAK
ncbi:hypothetical protein [Campylobacter lari]|uniref:hypothetical protein n=1 Tax=Campylobacter lari TaxID=201 RepID=UPI00069B3331|nr:hypothetical protein [Campylobacter lari]